MYLIDTNIWLERLLDQEKSTDVGRFLETVSPSQMMISDFSMHSIGVILSLLNKHDVYATFVDDVLLQGGVSLRTVPPAFIRRMVEVMKSFTLDFDDAYQYVVAELAQATIVSFDKDFDKTDLIRKTPLELV